jgi:hypothetical protein
LGLLLPPSFVLGLLLPPYFRDYYYPPILGIIPPPHYNACGRRKWWCIVKLLIHYTFYTKICNFRYLKNMFLINLKKLLTFTEPTFHGLFIVRSLFLHCCCCGCWDFDSLFCKYWVSWVQKADFEPCTQVFEFRPNIISCVAKLPDSTRRKEAIFNKGSLFYSHCAIANVFLILSHQ